MAYLFNQNKSKKTVQQQVDSKIAEMASSNEDCGLGNTPKERDISIDLENMERYLMDEKRRYSLNKRTIRYYKKVIHQMNKRYGIEYSYKWLNMVRDDLERRENKKNTINAYIIALRNLFQANGHKDTRIAFQRATKQNREKLRHSEAEIMQMINAAKEYKDRDFALLSVLWFAALRRGEASHLYVSDFQQRAGTGEYYIEVRDHGQGVKDYEERKIPLEVPCVYAIKTWLKYREEHNLTEELFPHMFISARDGSSLDEFRIYQIVMEYAVRAGIQKKPGYEIISTPHAWRRSRATFLYHKKKLTLPIIQKILGHSEIKTTMVYCMAGEDDIFDDIARLNKEYKDCLAYT